ncbi:sensor histidine kinase KdpD [Sphingomonas sp.]|uniref:sensor histidine kinase n=1 Tax=Sphingomonas sp. TaxID=28214 RepID=UPI0025D590CB|nr:sensor histidine kinase KdpD [Sphingomonas sp.]
MSDARPSPDALLRAAKAASRGRLKIFLGAAPGVGKTFEMLQEGAERQRDGADVVVAVVETHGRAETEALVAPLEVMPRRTVEYRGHALTEMDLDAVLARRPRIALVDEFAHTNAPGSRHPKRWQDVMELLDAGIDVFTTLNVQHVESLNDVVASFTRVRVRETVPDSVFDEAEVEVVDLPPDELIERLQAGKVYIPAEATRALDRFFSKANLSALREMALRRAALSVDQALTEHLDAQAMTGTFAGGERVLVAVSELPGADNLVRSAKRLADALKAPWQAVFIETPRAAGFDDAQRRQVADALGLAAALGATIATVPAESVLVGLRAQIAEARITQLVIGKSSRSWWFALRHRSVVEAILAAGEDLAVHVLPAATARPRARPKVADSDWSLALYGAVVIGLVAATTALARLAEPWVGVGGLDLIYLLPVIVASSRLGLWSGLATGVLSGLAYNFFFLPPIYTFTIADPQSVLTMFVFIGIATFTANLTGRLQVRATIGVRSAQENAAVAGFAQALARASDRATTATTICDEASRLLGVTVVLLDDRQGELEAIGAAPGEAPALGTVDRAAAEWAWSRGEATGVGTATLVSADWQFQPLKTSVGILGVLGLLSEHGGDPVGADRATLLATLLGQAALALERLRLEDQLREVTVLRERDRLRAALLSSIGHDLRTPLTSVAASIDALAVEHPDAEAMPVARADVARLRRFLDNLLDMVRIDTGAIVLSPEPIDLTDAVASAVHDLKDLLRGNHIDLRVPANLPLVRADPALLHHILINLLANAAIHGGAGPIAIIGERARDGVTLTIRDHGPGLEPGSEERVFDTFTRGHGSDRTGGSGLGLAIVKGFADAMGLTIRAANAPDHGAQFSLRFEAAGMASANHLS